MIRVKAKGDKRAEITIYGVIGKGFFEDGVTAEQVRKDLDALGDIDNIDVFVNSPGGNVWDGIAIANILSSHDAQVHAHVDGLAASAASVITSAADLVTMGTASSLMIHSPYSLFAGNAQEMRDFADTLDKVESGMIDIYEARSGKPRDELKALLKAETWFTAQEAVDAGFADDFVKAKKPESAAASWQPVMACFKNTPTSFTTPQDNAEPQRSAKTGATPQEKSMKDKTTAPDKPADNTAEIKAAEEKARKAERSRVAGITAMCGRHDMDAEFMASAIGDGTSAADVNAQILDKLAESTEGAHRPHPEIIEDERDKFIEGASKALLARVGLEKRDRGNEYSGMRLADIARACMRGKGLNVSGMSDHDVSRRIIALAGSDFPLLTSNLANKVLLAAFDEVPKIWDKIARVGQVSDFKTNTRLTRGSFGALQLKLPGGEYQRGSFGEDSATIKAATKGLIAGLTREMIVNDDISAFTQILQMLGDAAGRTVNSDVFAALIGNAPDGTALFHADHNNLAGTPAAMTVATLSVGKKAMRIQKDIDSNATIGARPTMLVVPVALEDTALTLIASETDPSQANSKKPNIHRNTLEVLSDPELDGQSATAWYMLAPPAQMPVIEIDFLDGNQTPFVDEDVNFETDSIDHKVRYDYGTAGVEYRGGWKNAGV